MWSCTSTDCWTHPQPGSATATYSAWPTVRTPWGMTCFWVPTGVPRTTWVVDPHLPRDGRPMLRLKLHPRVKPRPREPRVDDTCDCPLATASTGGWSPLMACTFTHARTHRPSLLPPALFVYFLHLDPRTCVSPASVGITTACNLVCAWCVRGVVLCVVLCVCFCVCGRSFSVDDHAIDVFATMQCICDVKIREAKAALSTGVHARGTGPQPPAGSRRATAGTATAGTTTAGTASAGESVACLAVFASVHESMSCTSFVRHGCGR